MLDSFFTCVRIDCGVQRLAYARVSVLLDQALGTLISHHVRSAPTSLPLYDSSFSYRSCLTLSCAEVRCGPAFKSSFTMILSLGTYAVRRVAAVAVPAPTSNAGVRSLQSRILCSFSSFHISSVRTASPSCATAASPTADSHLFHDGDRATASPPPAPEAAAAPHPHNVIVCPTAPRASVLCQLPQSKRCGNVAFTCRECFDDKNGKGSRQYLRGRRADAGRSSGFQQNVSGSCSLNTYSSSGNTELCSCSSNDSTCCSTSASSKSFMKWGSTGWNKAVTRTAGQDRNIHTSRKHDNLGFTFRIAASVHKGPSAPRGEDDLSIGSSSSSFSPSPYHPSSPSPSSSAFSASPCFLRRFLLSTPLRRAVHQREIGTTAAGLAVSAQPCTTEARRDAEGDWSREEEQIFSNGNTSNETEEVALPRQQPDGEYIEASNCTFAQVRLVPPAVVRAFGTVNASATIERTEEIDAEPATKLIRNASVPGEGAEAQEVAAPRKDVPPSGARSRRSQNSERRAPQLLRVTDAAAGRIREIVEMYNREAALAENRDEAMLRSGHRQQEKTTSDSSHVSRSNNSSSEMQHGANRRRRAIGIRIGLKKRGCSGLSYTIDVATCEEGEQHKTASMGSASAGQSSKGWRRLPAAANGDEIVETKGGIVVLAGDAILFLVGTELDFVDTELERKFVFRNPNEKQACGCGKSFTV